MCDASLLRNFAALADASLGVPGASHAEPIQFTQMINRILYSKNKLAKRILLELLIFLLNLRWQYIGMNKEDLCGMMGNSMGER